MKTRKIAMVLLLAFGASAGCGGQSGPGDGSVTYGSTTAYFAPDINHPERSLLPLPNILALQDTVPPTLSLLPSQCLEPGSASEQMLREVEKLNGFGTYSRGAILAYFGADVEEASLDGKVLLYDLGSYDEQGREADLSAPLRVAFRLTKTPKFIAGCAAQPAQVPTLVIIPVNERGLPQVLRPDHLYAVFMLKGIRDAEGLEVLPSYVWTLVRSKTAQSDLSLRLLQEEYKPLFTATDALGYEREEIILGWLFNTQVTDQGLTSVSASLGLMGDAYDKRAVTIPAQSLPVPPLAPAQFLGALGLNCDAIGAGPNCPGIAKFISAEFVSPRYQQAVHPPLPYLLPAGGREWVPGQFSSQYQPEVQGQAGEAVPMLISLPAGKNPPYPVVIFQHPLTPTDPNTAKTANKLAMLSLANNLGAAGFALVAMDGVLAGGRAIMVNNALTGKQQLYPVMQSDLFATRDNIRQTAVDLLQLVRVLKGCTVESCAGLSVDPARIYFLGNSLGAVSGALAVALSPDIKRAVFNAPSAGMADLLAGSTVLLAELSSAICAAGIVAHACCEKTPPLCTPADLADDYGFAQFLLTAQWILDPADPINYLARLRERLDSGKLRVLVQQVTGDQVFPNAQSTVLAGLLELGVDNFKSYEPGACAASPTGAHTMLLQNCGAGTVAMRTDLIQFLLAP